jgi:serine/threonine protein kinase
VTKDTGFFSCYVVWYRYKINSKGARMGIPEMQRQFTAYGSGQLPEFELRRAIRSALSEEPRLSQPLIDLVDAYRKANLIDASLYSTINSDIAEVVGPYMEMTMVRPAGFARRPWQQDVRAANSTDVNLPSIHVTSPLPPPMSAPESAPPRSNTNTPGFDRAAVVTGRGGQSATGSLTGSTTGSAWDAAGPLNEVSTPLYPGCVIRDRFVLVEELGRGGMGVVYKAYDRSRGDVKDRYVAIKILNEEFKRHPLAVRSLQREARKAQRLAHPNIVGVHDFDRDGGNVFMVMEFLTGRSLEQVLREDGQGGIPLGPAMDIIKCLGAALSYAHEQDIVHCDFKPGNAFLNRDGKVKVLDFGIARAAPSQLDKGDATLFDAGQLGAVSPAYASLEMLQRAPPDIRDDVYAFACVAYELLTGLHPYQRIDAAKAHQTGLKPRPIRKLSRTQWRALKQGLAFRRADRAPTIDSIVSQLVVPPNRAKIWIAAAAACLGVAAITGALVWKWPQVQRMAGQVHLPSTFAPSHNPVAASPPANAAPPPTADQSSSVPPPAAAADSAATAQPTFAHSEMPDRDLTEALVSPEPTAAWAARVEGLIAARIASNGPSDSMVMSARNTAAKVFVAAAAQARSRKQFDEATELLNKARTFDERASDVVSESIALERDRSTQPAKPVPAPAPSVTAPSVTTVANSEEKRAGFEMLKEQFESQSAAGDVPGATLSAGKLTRANPGSAYVSREVPQILAGAYLHLSKMQFTAGKLEESLQTLEDGRRKFAKSAELKDAQERYVAVADAYDHISSAVTLNVDSWKQTLNGLRAAEGAEFDTTAQMLAQTLADRIADHRAANRQPVADKLFEQGKQIFPDYAAMLSRGTAGVLSAAPIAVDGPN